MAAHAPAADDHRQPDPAAAQAQLRRGGRVALVLQGGPDAAEAERHWYDQRTVRPPRTSARSGAGQPRTRLPHCRFQSSTDSPTHEMLELKCA